MEIPKEIKFEFFLIFTGVILLTLPFWLFFWHQDIFQFVVQNNLTLAGLLLLLTCGVVLFIYGFSELAHNYSLEKDIFVRNYRLERWNLDKKLKRLPEPYKKNIKFPQN